MSQIQLFLAFTVALTVGALLNILQPLLADLRGSATRRPALLVALAIPMLAIAIYMFVGRLDLVTVQDAPAAHAEPHSTSIADLIVRLESQLARQPQDAGTAMLLARSYYSDARFAQALPAFERAFLLQPANASQLADYADALTAHDGGKFNVRAQRAIEAALALDANHVKSLWLAGSFAFNDQRPADASAYWMRLTPLLTEGSDDMQRLEANLARAGKQPWTGSSVAAKAAVPAGKKIAGTVSLAPGLETVASGGSTLYVFARAANGAPMPLAVMKTAPGPWPATFVLDESMAVMGGLGIGNQGELLVTARISLSGQAIGQPGDLESDAALVSLGAQGVRLLIDRVRR